MAKSKNQICNLVFWPVSKPRSSLKWAFWPFARPRQPGGGSHQNSDFQPKTKPLHPSKLAFWPLGGLGQAKNQAPPPSKIQKSKGEGGGGEGGGAPRPQPLQIRYLAFWGALGKLGNMQKNQKIKFEKFKG